MKKFPDIGGIIVLGIVFTLIFSFIQIAADKLHYPFTILIFGIITAWVALYWQRVDDKIPFGRKRENKEEVYEFGTNRQHTELDNSLDEFILEKYYKEHNEKRTLEKDKEILEKTYLKPRK